MEAEGPQELTVGDVFPPAMVVGDWPLPAAYPGDTVYVSGTFTPPELTPAQVEQIERLAEQSRDQFLESFLVEPTEAQLERAQRFADRVDAKLVARVEALEAEREELRRAQEADQDTILDLISQVEEKDREIERLQRLLDRIS